MTRILIERKTRRRRDLPKIGATPPKLGGKVRATLRGEVRIEWDMQPSAASLLHALDSNISKQELRSVSSDVEEVFAVLFGSPSDIKVLADEYTRRLENQVKKKLPAFGKEFSPPADISVSRAKALIAVALAPLDRRISELEEMRDKQQLGIQFARAALSEVVTFVRSVGLGRELAEALPHLTKQGGEIPEVLCQAMPARLSLNPQEECPTAAGQ